ncbi:hypothetical protein FIBSPDRAFT_983295 [Athelia psychrophila]|uniref:Homeobox domain-containing protein n=1 Tax=Athelia psychrophila TaxID=1759441 RepID=A0A166C2D0_9AGAM|nr:hypothetical protein FIBSPDRAFT_983295 [Fibularhizoctonia sp. CBS 109695]
MASETSHLALEPPNSTEVESKVINVAESGARLSVAVCRELARLWSLKQQIPTLTSINAWSALWNVDGLKVRAWFVRKRRVANRAGTFVEGDYELTLDAPPPAVPKKRVRKRKIKGSVSVKREPLSSSPPLPALVPDPPPPPTVTRTKNIGKPKEKSGKKKTGISVKRELLSPAPLTSKRPRLTTEQLANELEEAVIASNTIPISKDVPIPSSPVPRKANEISASEPCAYTRSSRRPEPQPSDATQAPSSSIPPDAQPAAPRISAAVSTELQRIWSLKQQIPTKTSIDAWSALWNADANRVNAWFARRRLAAKRARTFVEGTYEMALDPPTPPPPPPVASMKNAEKKKGNKRKRDDGVSVKRELLSPSPPPSKKPRTDTDQLQAPDDDDTGIPGSEDTLIPSSSPAPEKEQEVIPFEPYAYTRSSRRLRALSPVKIPTPKELRYSISVSAPGSPSPSPSPSRSPTPAFQYPVLSFDDYLIVDRDPHASKTEDTNTKHFDATDCEESEPLVCGVSSGFTCTLCLSSDSDMDATSRPYAIPSCAYSTAAPSASTPIFFNVPLSFFLRNASSLSSRTSTEFYLAILEGQHTYWESKVSPSLADATLVGFDRAKGQVVFKLRSG